MRHSIFEWYQHNIFEICQYICTPCTQKPVSAAFHRILDQAVELAVFCKPSIGFNVMVFIVVAIAVASILVTAAIVQQQTQ